MHTVAPLYLLLFSTRSVPDLVPAWAKMADDNVPTLWDFYLFINLFFVVKSGCRYEESHQRKKFWLNSSFLNPFHVTHTMKTRRSFCPLWERHYYYPGGFVCVYASLLSARADSRIAWIEDGLHLEDLLCRTWHGEHTLSRSPIKNSAEIWSGSRTDCFVIIALK